jgi:protein-disulfide isomerase
MKKILGLACVMLLTVSGAVKATEDVPHTDNTEITTPELLTQKLGGDIVYGKDDAPVVIVEYASLSCSHCKSFHDDVFKKIKTNYVETGKVKFVYRHFPLNLPALQAALLVECVADEKKQGDLVSSLFITQSQWAYKDDFSTKLGNIGRIAGIDQAAFNDCISDTEKEEELLADQLKAQQGLAVRSTPTIFINGKPHVGAKTYDEIRKIVDGML